VADTISPRRQQYVWQWLDWPSSAVSAHGCQHYCDTRTLGPVTTMNRHKEHCHYATPLCGRGFTNQSTIDQMTSHYPSVHTISKIIILSIKTLTCLWLQYIAHILSAMQTLIVGLVLKWNSLALINWNVLYLPLLLHLTFHKRYFMHHYQV